MPSKAKIDPENPPLVLHDLIGACKVFPDRTVVAPDRPMRFHIFRASKDKGHFALSDDREAPKLPPCPAGKWEFWKSTTEAGYERVGFDEAEARANIEEQGWRTGVVRLEPRSAPRAAE